MDALNRIKAHLSNEREWVQKLCASLFEFSDAELVSLVEACSVLEGDVRRAHDLAECYELDQSQLRELRKGMAGLVEQVGSITHRITKHQEALSAIDSLLRGACSLMEEHSLLTGLSGGFSLTGSRDHVHDDHFDRVTVYTLSDASMNTMKENVQTLLSYGRLVPMDSVQGGDAPPGVQAVQAILLGYGIGLSRAPSRSLFMDPPQIWVDLQEIASEARQAFRFVTNLQQHSDADSLLRAALPAVDGLLSKAPQIGEIKLDGFFGAKKGVDQIRSALRVLIPDEM